MVPFYGWGSTASRLEALQGGSLLFTTKFPEIPGIQDPLENYFVRQRSMDRQRDNPNLRSLGSKLTQYAVQKLLDLFLAIHAKSGNKYRTFTLSYKQLKI